MLLLVRFLDGSIRSAFLMAVIGSRVRVAVHDCGDAVEYRLAGGEWRNESSEPVEIEFDPGRDDFERYARPVVKPGAGADAPVGCATAVRVAGFASCIN